MNEETNVDVSYLSCDINGTRYIYKIAPMDVATDGIASEEQDTIDIAKEPELEKEVVEEEEPISVVCLNGQMYMFQNGVLQELDTTQPVEQMDNCHEKPLLVSKEVENCENEYIANGNIVVENAYEPSEGQYEVVTGEAEKDLALEDNNINTDDFMETITAFKCKLCAHITQDKIQLLEHIQKVHLDSTESAEVNSSLEF